MINESKTTPNVIISNNFILSSSLKYYPNGPNKIPIATSIIV
ncbi:MAG: hypothetical protein ACTHME_06535 [Candidatus Nitrosocosmicus sp.]